MEVAGLAIGIAGLAGIFSTCLDVIEKIDSYKDATRNSATTVSQFNAYKVLFQQWGEAVGFDKNHGLRDIHHRNLDDRATFTAVQDLLIDINEIVGGHSNTSSLSQQFELGLAKSGDQTNVKLGHWVHNLREPLSRRKKAQWTLRDNKRFSDLVQQFGVSVGQLYALVPLEQKNEHAASFDALSIILDLRKQNERNARNDLDTWLCATRTQDSYDNAMQKRLDGTCDWILERDAFGKWRSSNLPQKTAKILWISGPAGYGKTVLSARITQHLTSLGVSVAAFFFSADLEDRADPYIVIRSWISQVISHNQDAFDLADDMREAREGRTASRRTIIELFMAIVQSIPDLAFIVDGLDECTSKSQWGAQDDSLAVFVQMITQATAGTSSRVLIVSREDQDIRDGFSGHEANGERLELIEYKIKPDDVKADAAMFSQSIVDRKLSKRSEKSRNELSQRIVDRCDSMFLRIKLLENDLSEWKGQKKLEHIIDQMPEKLSGLYDQNWERIQAQGDDKSRAFSILRWAAFASRPLTVLEIAGALLVEDDDYADSFVEGFPYPINEHYVERRILALCASLIETRTVASAQDPGSWTIHLSHFTVREYILSHMPSSGALLIANEALWSTDESVQNNILAKACLQYLCVPRLWDDSGDDGVRKFKEYAASSWYQHLNSGGSNYDEVIKLVVSFFRPDSAEWEAWRRHYDIVETNNLMTQYGGQIMSANRLFYASILGIQEIIRYLITECKIDVNSVDESKRTALLGAASAGRDEQIRYLLENGADVHIASAELRTPLYAASHNGHLHAAKLLLEKGADVNVSRKNGWTPLSCASNRGHVEIVKLLLDKGADVTLDVPNNSAWTPLYSASSSGHVEVVKLLLNKGADVTLDIPNNNGWTPLYCASDHGHVEIVKLLLEKGADVTLDVPNNGWTPLNCASNRGHVEVVKLLLDKGADVTLDVPNHEGWTPLHSASYRGHVEVVKLLLDKGAEVAVNIPTNKGWAPLHFASDCAHVEIVKLLLDKGADVNLNVPIHGGTAPLHAASYRGHVEVVKLLLDSGADVAVNIPTNKGWAPLHFASECGHAEVVKLLLEKGADVMSINDGWTPLKGASIGGHVEVVRLLLDKGAELDVLDDEGQTPLHAASIGGHVEVVKLLLDKGAELDVPDDDGQTPLYAASIGGHVEVVRILLEKGADLGAPESSGLRSLHAASGHGHVEVVRLLLEAGAVLGVPDNNGSRPLHMASAFGHVEVVKLLLEKGADLAVPGHYGLTPLYYASCEGHVEVVRLLLETGAEITVPNPWGMTALYIASLAGHVEVVRLLLERGADLTVPDCKGRTPLFLAMKNGQSKALELLMPNHIQINKRDYYGSTALSIAVRCGRNSMVDQLLAIPNIDISSEDKFGRTPLWWARKQCHVEIEARLLDHAAKLGLDIIATIEPELGEPALFDAGIRSCDVCMANINGLCYYCTDCDGGDFDICLECEKLGAHCLDESHILSRR